MSEWLDLHQNKHDSPRLHEKMTFDEQIAAALQEDTLDRDDKKRLAKLGRICTELKLGKKLAELTVAALVDCECVRAV